MKNEDAVNQVTGVIIIVALTVLLAAGIAYYVSGEMQKEMEKQPKYTENITISYVEFGDGGASYTIVSTDNVEYSTVYSHIYNFAKQNVGQTVNVVYVAGKNNECVITEIHLITNRTVCTVDKCGTPIGVK